MDNGTIIQLIESIGLPSALSIYLLYLSNKHVEKIWSPYRKGYR